MERMTILLVYGKNNVCCRRRRFRRISDKKHIFPRKAKNPSLAEEMERRSLDTFLFFLSLFTEIFFLRFNHSAFFRTFTPRGRRNFDAFLSISSQAEMFRTNFVLLPRIAPAAYTHRPRTKTKVAFRVESKKSTLVMRIRGEIPLFESEAHICLASGKFGTGWVVVCTLACCCKIQHVTVQFLYLEKRQKRVI